MALAPKQYEFAQMLDLLTAYIRFKGYRYTIGHVYRCADCKVGKKTSLHKLKLAADINLYDKNWNWLKETEDHRQFGEFWEFIGGTWGGRFDDGNHYSLAYNGMR